MLDYGICFVYYFCDYDLWFKGLDEMKGNFGMMCYIFVEIEVKW